MSACQSVNSDGTSLIPLVARRTRTSSCFVPNIRYRGTASQGAEGAESVSAVLTPLKELLALCLLPALAFPPPECSILEWAIGSLQFSSIFSQMHADPAVTTKDRRYGEKEYGEFLPVRGQHPLVFSSSALSSVSRSFPPGARNHDLSNAQRSLLCIIRTE